jgi:hypothetical protein
MITLLLVNNDLVLLPYGFTVSFYIDHYPSVAQREVSLPDALYCFPFLRSIMIMIPSYHKPEVVSWSLKALSLGPLGLYQAVASFSALSSAPQRPRPSCDSPLHRVSEGASLGGCRSPSIQNNIFLLLFSPEKVHITSSTFTKVRFPP